MLSRREAPHGVCISLACYRLPELFDTIKSESGKHDIEELTSKSSCSWPYSNLLSLHVNDEMRQTVITLSPPLFVRVLDRLRSSYSLPFIVVDLRSMRRHILTDEAGKQHTGDQTAG